MLDKNFKEIIAEIKGRIRTSQFRIISSANKEMLELHLRVYTLLIWGS